MQNKGGELDAVVLHKVLKEAKNNASVLHVDPLLTHDDIPWYGNIDYEAREIQKDSIINLLPTGDKKILYRIKNADFH